MDDEKITLTISDTISDSYGSVTLSPLFSAEEINLFASMISGISEDQAIDVALMCAEMIRQIECRRINLPTE